METLPQLPQSGRKQLKHKDLMRGNGLPHITPDYPTTGAGNYMYGKTLHDKRGNPMLEEITSFQDNEWTVYFDDSIRWPSGLMSPAEIKIERNLSGRLKAMGFRLIADRTLFRDPHFQGGYQIVSSDTILAGRDYDLTLPDVAAWTEQQERKCNRKRA